MFGPMPTIVCDCGRELQAEGKKSGGLAGSMPPMTTTVECGGCGAEWSVLLSDGTRWRRHKRGE